MTSRAPDVPGDDPVRARRARIAAAVAVASRVGYGLFALAIVLFVVGFATTFSGAVATATLICLVAGCVVLAPSIILGYAVKSAERHDREHGR